MKLHDELVLMSGLCGRASLFSAPTNSRRNETNGIWNGLTPSMDRKEVSRTAKILDALAQVGVTSREVIAVAVAPPSETNINTVLFIASNETVPIATQQYYHTLLRLIKQLALSHIPHQITIDPHTVSPPKNEETESLLVKGLCLPLCILVSPSYLVLMSDSITLANCV